MFTRVNIICSGSKAENVFLFCQLKLAFCFDVETFFCQNRSTLNGFMLSVKISSNSHIKQAVAVMTKRGDENEPKRKTVG